MMPRVPSAETNDVGVRLLGRARCPDTSCEPYDTQLNELSYSPYAQQSALMAHAAAKTPTVATTGLAVDVRACFNSRSLIVLLTTGLTQAVRKMGPGDAGQWVVNPGAIYLSRSTSGSTVGVLRVEKGRKYPK